jgi:hypothetical protein
MAVLRGRGELTVRTGEKEEEGEYGLEKDRIGQLNAPAFLSRVR